MSNAQQLNEPTWYPPCQPLRKRIIEAAATPTKIAIGITCVALAGTILFVAAQTHAPEIGGEDASGENLDGTRSHFAESHSADPATLEGEAHQATSEPIFVHVIGAVHHPGVFELTSGQRVSDALAAAGGATSEALVSGVNLARKIADGEQIHVPDVNSSQPPTAAQQGNLGANGVSHGGLLNINFATSDQLDTLPRVGATLAGRILEWRETNGPFQSIEQLTQVQGIGEVLFAGIRDLVVV